MLDIKTGKELSRRDFGKGIAAILASGCAPSVMGGMMRNTGGAMTARFGGGVWTNPYVTDGLVAMWDGEWNAGGGVHKPNTTVWKDLSGNGYDADMNQLYVYSVPCYVWTENSVKRNPLWSQAYKGGSSWFAWAKNVPTNFSTVEIVCSSSSSSSSSHIFILITRDVGRNVMGGPNSIVSFSNGTVGYFYQIGNTNLFSCSYNESGIPTNPRVNNATPISSGNTVQFTTGRPISGIYLGGRDENLYLDGEIFCVRLYNKVLKAEGSNHNYAIDKARFNIP